MNLRFIYFIAVTAFAAFTAPAQELHGDVTVTADYLPTLRSHSRVSPLPGAPRLSLPETSLNVAYQSVPTLLQPSLAPMSATGWKATKRFSRYPGYLELAAGSYVDIALDAGYRFIDSDKATLGAWIQHLSSTGYKPENGEGEKCHAAKRFDETLGIYGQYGINGIGRLDFDIAYHLGYFNYYSDRYIDLADAPKPPTQTLNDLHAQVGLRSANMSEGFNWNVVLSDRYFGYRKYYREEDYMVPDFKPSKENNLQLDGMASYGFNPSTSVNLGLTANMVSYSEIVSEQLHTPSGYRRLALNPAFNFADDNFTAHVGLRLDMTSTVGRSGQALVQSEEKFGHLHAAPDVTLSYRNGKFAAELKATGGTELRTLASGAELYYYQSPQILTTIPLFSPLNASLIINAGSFYGLSAHIGMAYKVTDNTAPDLLYNVLSSYGTNLLDNGIPYTINLKGISLLAGVKYTYGDVVTLGADMSYQPQNGTTGYYNGPDRPRWILDIKADVNPWNTLHVYGGYHYRGVRNIWYSYRLEDNTSSELQNRVYDTVTVISRRRLGDVTDLNIGASYTFLERYTVRLDANNLLGTRNPISIGMPSEGMRIMGGISILF